MNSALLPTLARFVVLFCGKRRKRAPFPGPLSHEVLYMQYTRCSSALHTLPEGMAWHGF